MYPRRRASLGRPGAAHHSHRGTVHRPWRRPAPGRAAQAGSPDCDGTSSAPVPRIEPRTWTPRHRDELNAGSGSESTLGVVVDSTIAEPNDVFVDWWRRSPVGQPTLEEQLVLGPGRMPPPWSADGQGRTVRQRHGHHQPQSSPRKRQRDDDVDVDRSPRCTRRPWPRLPDRANEHHPRRGLGPAEAGRSVAKFVCGVARRVPCHATWLARDRPDPAVNLAVCPCCSRATCSRRPAP